MQIIWDQAAAEELKRNQTILELETFQVEGKSITAYCVVPAECLLPEIAQLEAHKTLHDMFISALNEKNYSVCQDLSKILIGKFSGELDTFYNEILSRISK